MDCYFSAMNKISPLVSPTWLADNLDNPTLILIDGSLQVTQNQIIPNALSFNWDKFSDLSNSLPHMMPDEDQFTQSAQELGINNNSTVVVYDSLGIYSSARIWWMFRAMGLANCYVLNGGLPEWIKEGYDCVGEFAKPAQLGDFKAVFNVEMIVCQEEVLKASRGARTFIIDARSADRFNGKIAEPRAGLRLGHIPNSINIPYEDVLFEKKMRSNEELEVIFNDIYPKSAHLIFSCGSGVTACICALAASLIGYQQISVYDGSWSEWGLESDYPVEMG